MTESNVTHLREVQAGESFRIEADACLEGMIGDGPRDVVICGRKPDGEIIMSSNCGDGLTLLVMEQAKMMMILGTMESDG